MPFLILRRLSGHEPAAAATTPNKAVVVDRGIQAYTTLLSGLIYGVTLFVATKTFLPYIFVVYHEGIARVDPALYDSAGGILAACALTLLFGEAARSFIFNPYAATGQTAADAQVSGFDPARATLGETLWWNAWGYTTRTKVAIRRTAVVAFAAWANTYLQSTLTVGGVESYGAAVYSSVWAACAILAGLALEVVGDV